jgi:hypothetical protein
MKRQILGLIVIVVLAGFGFLAYQSHHLAVAHSTFDNYYAFRGCEQLIDRTDTYGDCKLKDGSTIRIVKSDTRWFLEGDLPQCGLTIGSTCLFNWP